MALSRGFWSGKKVLITGHTGFKGAWLSLLLERLEAKIYGYSLAEPVSTPNLYAAARVGESVESTSGDVRDLESLARAVAGAKPDVVFHMAAQPLVRRSYQYPAETYATNVTGTVNLLEAVRRAGGIKAVVAVTSDKCYEQREGVRSFRESDPLGGHDPYSSSKACAELVAAAYRSSFFSGAGAAAVATARAGNVIGGGDWAEDRLLPDLVRAISGKTPVSIRKPESVRPWQHVLDPLSGYLTLARRLVEDGPNFAEGWNFGPREGDARSVKWVAEGFLRHWPQAPRIELAAGAQPHEAAYLRLDCSKAASRLAWTPRWDLEAALERTALWYQAFLAGKDMRAFTKTQIEEHLSRARGEGGLAAKS
ncbi:MAG TPA: CDP-glucose 4,6-dehydratase [Elusimicrobiota bacterium]|nr:CDP-glucose 4,6-dehydratase [Elusimicrobiota bacterium]